MSSEFNRLKEARISELLAYGSEVYPWSRDEFFLETHRHVEALHRRAENHFQVGNLVVYVQNPMKTWKVPVYPAGKKPRFGIILKMSGRTRCGGKEILGARGSGEGPFEPGFYINWFNHRSQPGWYNTRRVAKLEKEASSRISRRRRDSRIHPGDLVRRHSRQDFSRYGVGFVVDVDWRCIHSTHYGPTVMVEWKKIGRTERWGIKQVIRVEEAS